MRGQNDRRAGYARVLELLKGDEERVFPEWHPKAGERGSPRFFVLDSLELQLLVDNLRDAPIEDVDSALSRFPGEAVDQVWEHNFGHAHAALRYGLMSRPQRSPAADEARRRAAAAALGGAARPDRAARARGPDRSLMRRLPGYRLPDWHPLAGREAYRCDVCRGISFPPDWTKGCPYCNEEGRD